MGGIDQAGPGTSRSIEVGAGEADGASCGRAEVDGSLGHALADVYGTCTIGDSSAEEASKLRTFEDAVPG